MFSKTGRTQMSSSIFFNKFIRLTHWVEAEIFLNINMPIIYELEEYLIYVIYRIITANIKEGELAYVLMWKRIAKQLECNMKYVDK